MYNPFYVTHDLNTRIPSESGTLVPVFADGRGNILCQGSDPVREIPGPEMVQVESAPILVGSSGDTVWMVHRISPASLLPPSFRMADLRSLATTLPPSLLGIYGRAIQLARFDLTTTFCGECGAGNRMKEDEIAKICPSCGLLTFPRLSPAIIVRITDGDRILLARSPGFPAGMFSVLAGFVEPGESLEGAVHREILEEVGVRITGLEYFGSQPWPFPDSLMIGFTARYLSGEVRCDGVEIEEAGWFERTRIPSLPGPLSISRALIDDFLAGGA